MDASVSLFGMATRILIEVEVAPSSEDAFVAQYMAATGLDPRKDPHYQGQENKWGVEARIYFDGPDWLPENLMLFHYGTERRAGVGYRADYAYRVNNQHLFWKMVRAGYRLGPNRPIVA